MKVFPVLKKGMVFIILFSFFNTALVMNYGLALEAEEIPIFTNIEFPMFESCFTERYLKNASSIDIELPSSSWSVKDIEINFTNIKFSSETKIIEENPTNNVVIDKFHDGFGV